jgi:ferredoxin
MRIVVNPDICEMHGECTIAAPELFELDDDDDAAVVKVLVEHPSGPQEDLARKAAHICPVGAITLED